MKIIQMRAFWYLTLQLLISKCRLLCVLCRSIEKPMQQTVWTQITLLVDPDHTAPRAVCPESELFVCMPKLVLDVSLYMQQMTSADVMFSFNFLVAGEGLTFCMLGNFPCFCCSVFCQGCIFHAMDPYFTV